MTTTMKAMKLIGLRQMEMDDVPMASIEADNDVLIKMACVGICGSDVHYYDEGAIGDQIVEFPFTVGHEGSGTVVEVGSAVTHVKPGDRIAIEPALPCWKCDQCLAGRPHTCRHGLFLGCPGQREGCLSEYLVMPEESCFLIPDTMTMEQAATVEPLTIGLWALKLAELAPGASIGIIGSGPIGICVLLAAKAAGAGTVYMTDKIDARLEMATRAGADWVGNPKTDDIVAEVSAREPSLLDAVFECSGDPAAIDQAPRLLKPGGKLLLVGIPGASNRVSMDINVLRRREICIQNVRRQNGCMQAAIDGIADGSIDTRVMITHRLPFEKTGEGFDMVTHYRDGVVKAMVTIA